MNMKKKNRVRLIGELFLLIMVWGMSTGCTEETVQSGTDNRKVVNINCRLQVDPLVGEPVTRTGTKSLVVGEGTTDAEAEVKNLTVIQFDGEITDAAAPMVVVRTFNNLSSGDLSISLMQPPANKSQFLYFISNIGDALAHFSGTLGELKAKVLTISREGSLSDGIIMTGTYVWAQNSGKVAAAEGTSITVKLTRRFAKIRFTYTISLPEGDTFEPAWLQLLSVPQTMTIESTEGTTSTSVGFSDFYPVLKDIEKGYVWYIPENKQGTRNNTSGLATGKVQSIAPTNSTCILLEGNYIKKGGERSNAYYRFYPGGNNINDFNLEGNKLYDVVLTIKGMDNSDGRVTSATMAALPGANCYMTAPGTTLTFNPYAAAGVDVEKVGWTYANRMGTKGNGKIDHVGLVWQTAPGLIKTIYNLVSSGEIRLTTDNKQGNALIAAYDASNNILWSWHIWVSEYVLGTVNDNMSNNTAAAMTNGNVYKWENYIWMDRGIGALSASPGAQSFGMIYQWGRKDPFNPVGGANNELIPIYDENGNRVYISGKSFTSTSKYIFEEAMNSPTQFCSFSSISDWYGTPGGVKLWDYTNKTCFDPCPAGWCIPPVDAIKNFNNTSYTTVVYPISKNGENRVYAKNLPGLFWPYLGNIEQFSGTGGGFGEAGINWTSEFTASGVFNPRIYGGFGNKYDTYQGAWHVYRSTKDGLGGRCVKSPTNKSN